MADKTLFFYTSSFILPSSGSIFCQRFHLFDPGAGAAAVAALLELQVWG